MSQPITIRPMHDLRYFSPLAKLARWGRTTTGICAIVDDSQVLIDILRNDLFRIEITPPHRGDEPQVAVCVDRSAYRAEFAVGESEEGIQIRTDLLTIDVAKAPFRIDAYRTDGSPILESSERGGLGFYARLNDAFIVTRKRSSGDLILGLGEKTGGIDRNGKVFTLWNVDLLNPETVKEFGGSLPPEDPRSDPRSTEYDPYYISIPFYQAVDSNGRAAGFFVDNVRRALYDFSSEGETRVRFEGGRYVEYVFAGPSLAKILEQYTELTGRIAAPPVWSLGYHHCRWHPYTQEDVLKHAFTYRERQIPCDSIWLDIEHMDGYRVFTWNPKLYPEPAKMLSDLKDLGFRSVTIIDPGVKVEPGYSVYDSGLALGAFCRTEGGAIYQGQVWPGKTAFPDFASARARRWWGELNAKHVQFGLAGIWNDMNEPATGDIPPGAMRFDEGRYSHGAYHNAYAMLMAMGTHEGLRKALPDRRPFVLSRAGSAGIQRYAANWLGDNMSRWEHLRMSVPMSLGLGLSGQPFVGADIGGFGENCNPELLVRWTQLASLMPFCRNHNDAGSIDQYPWSFGPKVEACCKAALELRYRLMPYLYTTFVQSSQRGLPIMAPMVLESQDRDEFRHVDDQFLLGPSLLVAPILEPKVRARKVLLPEGTWFDWWTGEPHRGSFRCKAPLDRVPLFAREGAVVPMWPETPPSTMDYHPEVIDLRVFVPPNDGVFESRLVEDDGETLGYERGERLTTTFRVVRQGNELRIEGATEGAPYPGFRRKAFRFSMVGTARKIEERIEVDPSPFSWTMSLSD